MPSPSPSLSARRLASCCSAISSNISSHVGLSSRAAASPRSLSRAISATAACRHPIVAEDGAGGQFFFPWQPVSETRVKIRDHLRAIDIRRQTSAWNLTSAEKLALKEKKNPLMLSLDNALRLIRICHDWEPLPSHVQVSVHLNPQQLTSPLNNNVMLPHSLDNTYKILVFARGEQAETAKKLGAALVGAEDLVLKIESGDFDAELCICTRECLPLVQKLGRFLGPRNLMPSERRGTVVDDVASYIQQSSGILAYKSDADGCIRADIGKLTLSDEQLEENIETFVERIKEDKDKSGKPYRIENMMINGPFSQAFPFKLE